MRPTVALNASRACRTRQLAALAILLVALAAAFLARSGLPPASAGTPTPPNIVFILADDQTVSSFRPDVMPQTFSRVVDPGTKFRQALATPPLCCPYRAGFITGQHAHNHGVTTNKSGFSLLLEPANVLPAWLRASGYETALVGKYLNGTWRAIGADAAPGWDEWYAADLSSGFVNPQIADNGHFVTVPGYLTDVLTDRAVDFIEDRASEPDPFFLWLSEIAPHNSASTTEHCPSGAPQPTAQDYLAFNGPSFAKIRTDAFNEDDVSDKPKRISEKPSLTREQVEAIHLRWRCTVAALASVDRGVDQVMDALQDTGQLDNTVVVYGSDNGVFFGEHRIRQGKGRPYDVAWRVPFAMRVPADVLGATPDRKTRELVTQQDLTATLLELADAAPCTSPGTCRRLDGHSLLPLLRGDTGDWPRRKILYELWPECPRMEIGIRTDRFVFSRRAPECGGGQGELYDLTNDPFELENLVKKRPDLAERLLELAEKQRTCTGVAERDEPLFGRPFCR